MFISRPQTRNKSKSFFLTTEGELPQSGKRSRPGVRASEKTLLRPQVWKSTACGG